MEILNKIEAIKHRIFDSVLNEKEFEKLAMEVFYLQAAFVYDYKEYIQKLNIKPEHVTSLNEIPFMPVEFFKSRKLIMRNCQSQKVFTSSGTTGMETSKHYIVDTEMYERSFTSALQYFYNQYEDYCILALLPSYLEREGSSLIYMADYLIKNSKHRASGFFLNELDKLLHIINENEKKGIKSLLLGVSFALLDFAEQYSAPLKHTIIMETGGMKGRRKELTRRELHTIIKNAFSVDAIHSEYGMTELLSQAYSKGDGIFFSPPWMKIRIRDPYDPFCYQKNGQSGGVNIIDLANLFSCAFIETEDIGKLHSSGGFEILGRFDSSDIRGCNLLLET